MKITKIRVLDTTLRDGEQSPGAALRPESKLTIARALDLMRVDTIEVGFPVISKGEMRAARMIAEAGLKAELCGLARCAEKDIDAMAETGLKYVHTFIATSDTHLKFKLGISRKEALMKAQRGIEYAKSKGMMVEFSAEDATRTEMRFLKRVYRAAENAGADRINIPDTVGFASPKMMARITGEIVSAVSIPVSVHCHNDMGLAVANSMAAVEAGARCVHVTVNGIGERAGNAALEEVAAVLRYMKLDGRYEIGIDTRHIYQVSQMVSKMMRMPVQPNKAIVGANAFSHGAGIHTHGMVNNRMTYECLNPTDFGRETTIVAGKHSGIHGIRATLEKNGIAASDAELRGILDIVKRTGDKGKEVSDAYLMSVAKRAKKM